MPLDRQVAFSVKWVQLLDGALVWLAFWLASLFRTPIRELFIRDPFYGVGDIGLWQMSWVLYLVVPLTPFALAFFHFYQRPRPKSLLVALGQIAKALACMTLLVGALVIFAELGSTSRIVLVVAGFFALSVLLLRDRLFCAFLDREKPGPVLPASP